MATTAEANLVALMQATGIGEEQAVQMLAQRIRIEAASDHNAQMLREYTAALLKRTLHVVPEGTADLVVHIGMVEKASQGAGVFVEFSGEAATFSSVAPTVSSTDPLPPLFLKLVACYLAGFVISRLVRCEQFAKVPDVFRVSASALGLKLDWIAKGVSFHDDVLIGGGGVASGFLWALQDLPSSGHLYVVDNKSVSDTNLNRCLFFSEDDVGTPKAEVLANKVKLRGAELKPVVADFNGHVKSLSHPPRRVFTTVDSRRARRSVRLELPLQVLDASTTDVSAVVTFSERELGKLACLSCIYKHVAKEDEHERAVAEHLGLTVVEVQQRLITAPMAKKIIAKYPQLATTNLLNIAVETLFRDMCGSGVLGEAGGEQTVAPLGFISNLAGALLVVELLHIEHGGNTSRNYLQLNPWMPPYKLARISKERVPKCEFCDDGTTQECFRQLWPDVVSGGAQRVGIA